MSLPSLRVVRSAGLGLVVLATLAGCRSLSENACNKPQVYAQAESVQPLRIPAGLDAPNTRGALRIPELSEPEAPRKLTDPCLDEPPRYNPAARLLPAGKDGKARGGARDADEGGRRRWWWPFGGGDDEAPEPAAAPPAAPPPAR